MAYIYNEIFYLKQESNISTCCKIGLESIVQREMSKSQRTNIVCFYLSEILRGLTCIGIGFLWRWGLPEPGQSGAGNKTVPVYRISTREDAKIPGGVW